MRKSLILQPLNVYTVCQPIGRGDSLTASLRDQTSLESVEGWTAVEIIRASKWQTRDLLLQGDQHRVQSAECGVRSCTQYYAEYGAAAPVSGCVGDSAGVLLVHCSAAATPHIASCSDQHPAAQQYIVTNIRLGFISLLKERCLPCAYTHDI